MTWGRYEVQAGVDSRVVVVVERALDFQLLLQVTLKLPVDVVHHWLIAAAKTYAGKGVRNLSFNEAQKHSSTHSPPPAHLSCLFIWSPKPTVLTTVRRSLTLLSCRSYVCARNFTWGSKWDDSKFSKLVLNRVSIRVDLPMPVSPRARKRWKNIIYSRINSFLTSAIRIKVHCCHRVRGKEL